MAKPKLQGRLPSSGKRLHVQADIEESPQHQPPVFSLRYLRRGFSLSDCNQEEKAAFADTLHKLSQMTWAEINTAPRHGSGHEIISRSAIKASIPEHITEDVNLIAFRFHGKAPIVGYRDGRSSTSSGLIRTSNYTTIDFADQQLPHCQARYSSTERKTQSLVKLLMA